MTDIQKFFADVDRVKKHYRADHNGSYNAKNVCEQILSLFESNNRDLAGLPAAFGNYWMETYIRNSFGTEAEENEPTQEHLEKLGAMQSLLDGDVGETQSLSQEDWAELCSLTNFEAEDLPLDVLESMMTIFVDKKAIS